MAVWQYCFWLLPRQPLLRRYNVLPDQLNDRDYEEAWSQQPAIDVTCVIDQFVARYHSWSPEILMWGEENGNRIHVLYEEAKVVSVPCRICPGKPCSDFAAGVVSLAKLCDWVMVLAHQMVAEPCVESLVAAVANSNAQKFVTDPQAFMSGLADGTYHPE